jgi:uncharacterized protein YbjT (DUF2867 family)
MAETDNPLDKDHRLIALVIGATGATGKDLVKQLLADEDFKEIKIFVRRKSGIQHSKLIEHIVDFEKWTEWESQIRGDVAFSCLGTTLKSAGSKEAQKRIDMDYQYEFARIARNNHVPTFVLVSAFGASSQSRIFYSRIKGELEDKIKMLNFPHCIFFQPGMLDRPQSDRFFEVWGLKALRLLNQIGIFKSQKPLPTPTLAKAMIKSSKFPIDGIQVYRLGEIFGIGS